MTKQQLELELAEMKSMLKDLVNAQSNMIKSNTQNNIKGGSTGQITKNSKQLNEEELEFMRTQKNVRLRNDGRFEWQKVIGGERFYEIDRDYKILKRKIADCERDIKQMIKHTRFAKRLHKERPPLFDLCLASVKANRKDAEQLQSLLNKHLSKLTKPIDEYTKIDILNFLKELPIQPLTACQIIKKTFAEATEEGIIDRNPIATLKCPHFERTKGRWFTLAEQRLIHQHKHKSGMADEIDFYLMTGCRANEAITAKPDFENCQVFITRSKIDGTSGNVKISKAYCDILKEKWSTMFNKTFKNGNEQKNDGAKYGTMFRDFLVSIGLKHKDTCLHSLRHTFCSNLYYLGAQDKVRQYSMGHKDSRMTSDRYTTYDPNITKQDILAIYNGNLAYPSFDTNTALAS